MLYIVYYSVNVAHFSPNPMFSCCMKKNLVKISQNVREKILKKLQITIFFIIVNILLKYFTFMTVVNLGRLFQLEFSAIFVLPNFWRFLYDWIFGGKNSVIQKSPIFQHQKFDSPKILYKNKRNFGTENFLL